MTEIKVGYAARANFVHNFNNMCKDNRAREYYWLKELQFQVCFRVNAGNQTEESGERPILVAGSIFNLVHGDAWASGATFMEI